MFSNLKCFYIGFIIVVYLTEDFHTGKMSLIETQEACHTFEYICIYLIIDNTEKDHFYKEVSL